jgi:hypothetical protein
VRNCIFDGGASPHNTALGIYSQRDNNKVYNNIFLNLTGTSGGVAIRETDLADNCIYANNTIYNCRIGVEVYASPSHSFGQFYNNLVVGCSTADFTGTFGTSSHNLSSDATAPGTNSIINSSASLNFVSISSGAEDLHLKSTAPARDNGTDVSGMLGFNYDTDMDTRSGIWDIGADEYMGVLPVDLVHFQAKEYNGATLLEWITASENGNDHFEIERAIAEGEFMKIGQLDGAGFSTEEHWYRFIDDEPVAGKIYYRLKQVDFNGSWSYSPVRVIDRQGLLTTQLYPNPASDRVYLIGGIDDHNGQTISMINMNGEVVKVWGFTETQKMRELELPDVSPGVYLLRVVNDSGNAINLQLVVR